MVFVQIELSEELAENARRAGLLTSDKISELIEAELQRKRQEAAKEWREMADKLHEAAREEFGDMTEDEFMDMVNEEIRAVREERAAQRNEPEK